MNQKYRDMVTLPRPVSRTHAPMSARNRAAQFAPFAALTGFDGVIAETARTVSEKPELSEEEAEQLNRCLQTLAEDIGEKPRVEVTYFVRDKLKTGGAYECAEGFVKHIDSIGRTLCFTDGRIISIDDIVLIEAYPNGKSEREKVSHI